MGVEYVCVCEEGKTYYLPREECHKRGIKHKGVIGMGYQDGKYYFKKRSSEKSYPNMYEPAVVGHVTIEDMGDYQNALLRELLEELNIEIRRDEITFIGKIDYKDEIENLEIGIFLFELKGEPKLNHEATEGGFYTLEEIYNLLEKGEIDLTPYTSPVLKTLEEFI